MKRILFTLLVLATAICSQAQSLEECHQLARNNYPEIQKFDLINATEQYNLSNAAKAWIPQVMLSGQASYQSATPTYPEAFSNIMNSNGINMAGIRKDQYKVAVDVTQNIWDGGQSKANEEIAKAEANEQRSRLETSLYDLYSRVNNLYFGILLLDERAAKTRALITMLNGNLDRIRTYYKNGVAMQADVDAIEAELLTAQQSLAQILASKDSYQRMLEVLIGKPLESDTLQRPALTDVTNFASARPELALFDAQKSLLDAKRKAINSSVLPRFSAFAQGYYGYPGLDMFKSMMSADWTLNGIVGVKMSWNIGAFYTKNNNLEKINAAQRQIDVQRDVFLFNSQLQSTHDDGEITRLRAAVESDKRIVELRKKVRIAAESQLKNGIIDSTDLLRKITDETNAELNRSTHEIELLQAIYRLKTTLNQ